MLRMRWQGHKIVLPATLLLCSAAAGRNFTQIDCKASDAALKLSMHSDNSYYVANDAQLQSVCGCRSIDYVLIGAFDSSGCPTCTQASLDACKLQSITGKAPTHHSLYIGNCPLISSLRASGSHSAACSRVSVPARSKPAA